MKDKNRRTVSHSRAAFIAASLVGALRWAAERGHTKTVALLLERGADNKDWALRWAVKYGQTETVKLLLDNGADIHANNDLALRWAVEYGQTETVKLLRAHMKDQDRKPAPS